MAETTLTRTQRAAVEFLDRCLLEHEPSATVSGAAGTGKTAALNFVLQGRAEAGERIVRINNFVAGPLTLHRVLAAALGVAGAHDLSADQLELELRRALANAGAAASPILAVDDAQSLLPETLRYLCLMAGLQEAGKPLFRILLVGRPGFAMREATPRQFVLEPMRPSDSRHFVTKGLTNAGIVVADEVVQSMVQRGQGNLRLLRMLVAAHIASGKPNARRAIGLALNGAARTQSVLPAAVSRSDRRFGADPRLIAPVLVAAVVCAGLILRLSIPAHHRIAGGAGQSPATSGTALVVVPLPQSKTPPLPVPMAEAAASVDQRASDPAHAPQPPMPTSTSAPAPTITQQAGPAAQSPAAQVPPARPVAASGGDAAPPEAAKITQAGGRYRVYNISQCHHTMCPRWSVTDLARQSRFVAGFDLNSLHLSPALAQRIREGTVDLIVSGLVASGEGGDRRLQATGLEALVAHHGRYVPGSTAATIPIGEPRRSTGQDASAQALPSQSPLSPQTPSPLQAPPPGFLAYPSGRPTVQEAPLEVPGR